jgi:hypothetical protein
VRSGGSIFAAVLVALACASSAAALTPNEPSWQVAWGQKQVNMPAAWDITTGSPNVVIAVVDTGVSENADLAGALVPGWNFVVNNADASDYQGHGTASASIVAARGNDGQGVAGYCWRCKIMPVKVSNSGMDFNSPTTAAGIRWAVDHGARVISIGFSDEGAGGSPTDPVVASAIAYAAQHDVLVVASAGNTGMSGLTQPASDPGAYPTAAVDQSGNLEPWSTSGPWIHVAASACQLVSLQNSNFGELCGNSTTAPAIAGIAGLLLSVNASLTVDQLEWALRSTAVPVAGIAGGRVDAYKALLAVGGKPPAPPPPAPPPPPPPPPLPQVKQPTGPKMATRVQRGYLGKHRVVRMRVAGGTATATLQSPKASSCAVTIHSSSMLWLPTIRRRDVVVVTARRLGKGVYAVDMSCRNGRPQPYALAIRAVFA